MLTFMIIIFYINTHHHPIIHDWGDAVITHPFFSICSFLDSTRRQHNNHMQLALELEQSYLDAWSDYGTPKKLKSIMQNIQQLNAIQFVLSFSRIAECPGMHDLGDYKGMIAKTLRTYFI
jgi:hypothetical protein